ncbi:MAG: hypothetical protein QNK30_10250 [Bacteroidales bacterium]|nr:hypothetical protein [Bacteroidales bacterium]
MAQSLRSIAIHKQMAMHSKFSIIIFLLILAFSGCEKDNLATGLEGKVYKGPINPVEIVGQKNDAPFAAIFHVYDMKGNFVESFSSDKNGEFLVMLEPGDFEFRPDDSAPIINPERQVKTVTINPGSMTKEDLYFDTGIR